LIALAKKLALTAIATLVALLLGEAALRLAGRGGSSPGAPWFAGGNHPRFLFQPDDDAGYVLRPGFRGHERSMFGDFDVPVEIDAEGLRDHAHLPAAAPTVLAVGDSMTYGEGVEAGDAFPALLERATGACVVDAGVPGYGSGQMLATLDRWLPRLHPRLVVLSLSPLWDRDRCAHPFVYKDGFIVAAGYARRLHLIDGNLYLGEVDGPWIGTATAWAKARSRLARLLLPALGAAAHATVAAVRGGRPAPSPEAAAEPAVRNLLAARQRASAAGADLLVVLLDSRGDDYVRARDALERRLRDAGLSTVVLDREVPAADWPALRFPHDGHWNADGHRRVADVLAPRVEDSLARSGD
jgi:hypothetical protein